MTFSKPNASPATLTRNRVSSAPGSGLCVTCLDGCSGYCEVGLSALRGREVLYPQPFGKQQLELKKIILWIFPTSTSRELVWVLMGWSQIQIRLCFPQLISPHK